VTYYRSYEEVLFVQDGDASIYVQAPDTLAKVAPGDRVLIKGKTHDSYRPEFSPCSITFFTMANFLRRCPPTLRSSFAETMTRHS